MLNLSAEPWDVIVRHALACYPRECCGILLGTVAEGDVRTVETAVACRNAYEGDQSDRFELDPKDQFEVQREARRRGLEVLGFFHSHPDCDAYFSATDLKNSWPWYSNVVVSVRGGEIVQARAFRANDDQSASEEEELRCPQF